MPEAWTGELIGRMHNARIRLEDVGKQLGWSKGYVSMVLNGSRNPAHARERLEQAVEELEREIRGKK